MNKAYLVDGYRTPLGKIGGRLRNYLPAELVVPLIKQVVMEQQLDPDKIDDVFLGNVVGEGGNPARFALLAAGLPNHVPGLTLDRQCGAGLESINLAALKIMAGDGELILAGGTESCSREPWKLLKPENIYRDLPQLISRPPFAPDCLGDPEMGPAAENIARDYQITREAQDVFALQSHRLAVKALEQGKFTGGIVPIEPSGSAMDEGPRPGISAKLLQRMPPVFSPYGTVTAGNSCFKSDGAALALVVSERQANVLGMRPLARFVSSAVAGVDPKFPGLGPVAAVPRVLQKAKLSIEDIGLVEINEAFAAQVLACMKHLCLPAEKVNVNGGAIAFGHPYGASGALITLHLLWEMRLRGIQYGLVTLGIGGGMGIATIWENEG